MSCKVISFASFKGGAGRTVAMANVAYQLSKHCRVGCIDFDVEAGSLHEMFEVETIMGKKSLQHYFILPSTYEEFYNEPYPDYNDKDTFIQELVIDVKANTFGDWRNSNSPNGHLFLIKAEPDAQLNSLFYTGASMFDGFTALVSSFSKFLDLDYILIDCRSGISGMALPGLAYSCATVVFMRWARQHKYGTERFLDWYSGWLDRVDRDTKILLVATGVSVDNMVAIPYFCENDLKNIPKEIIIIPEIKKLIDCETIFWTVDNDDEQSNYINIAKALQAL